MGQMLMPRSWPWRRPLDLGDHFRFIYREHRAILADDSQPYTDGYRVAFDAYLGANLVNTIKIDLSAGALPTDSLQVEEPANRLTLPRLVTYPYRLYPVANQVADKMCATVADYNGRPSSREKDLVDLVVIAATQSIDFAALREAITTECAKRRLLVPEQFTIPSHWGPTYAKLVKGTPAEPFTITAARALLEESIDPVLACTAADAWHPNTREWS